MRTGLFLAAAVALLAPSPATAADPPIVFQTQPVSRLLDDFRAAVNLVGGEKAVKDFNDGIKRDFGEKGFQGLDLSRPVVGYVIVPPNPADLVAVVALPVTGEKEFLDLCERANKQKPKPVGNGLYELPAATPNAKALVRVTGGFAYIATSSRSPAAALDPKEIVPFGKLLDPLDPALVTGKVYFDRLPKETRDQAAAYLAEITKALEGANLPAEFAGVVKAATAQFTKMSKRYIDLSKGAKEAALRVNLDARSGEVSAELTLTAVPGSPLDTIITNKRPTANKFGGLLTKDTAVGFKTRLPFFNDELKEAAIAGLEDLKKQAKQGPQQGQAFFGEVLDAAIRTVKAGEVDLVGAIRGPDANGLFTAIGAIAVDDAAGIEKEFKKLIDAEAPEQFKGAFTWDAAKVGKVGIHTFSLAKLGFLGQDAKKTFGDEILLAFAFAPHGVFLALGPDPIAVVKEALALKPATAPVLDIVVNPSRLVRFIETVDGEAAGARAATEIGKTDALASVVTLSIAGGKELKVRLAFDLTLVSRIAGSEAKSTAKEK